MRPVAPCQSSSSSSPLLSLVVFSSTERAAKHSIAHVIEHVHTHIARVAVAGVALQTLEGLLPGVSPHVAL